MRDIRFRALEIDTANEIIGFPFYESGYDYIGNPVKRWYMYDEGSTRKREICEGTLSEFTGLTDRNGVDVYEGDILEYPGAKSAGLAAERSVVIFTKGQFVPMHSDGEISCRETLSRTVGTGEYDGCAVVIGNIHKHPYILEGNEPCQP